MVKNILYLQTICKFNIYNKHMACDYYVQTTADMTWIEKLPNGDTL